MLHDYLRRRISGTGGAGKIQFAAPGAVWYDLIKTAAGADGGGREG